ncbi:unnamed protein product, partial [Rotaria magnacalcarata]
SETVHSPPSSHHLLSDQPQITATSSPTVQYQPPWLDHHLSSTLQHNSQSRTSYNQYHCMHCTSQSNPHTPSAMRSIVQSSSSHLQNNNNPTMKASTVNTSETNKTTMDSMQQITMNSSSSNLKTQFIPSYIIYRVKHQSDHTCQVQSSNPIMTNSLDVETMTTSWISSIDDNNHESVSSSSTDKYEFEKLNQKQNHSSSEGSIFSDSDVQQLDEFNGSTSVNFERAPTFLIPNL